MFCLFIYLLFIVYCNFLFLFHEWILGKFAKVRVIEAEYLGGTEVETNVEARDKNETFLPMIPFVYHFVPLIV